MNIIKPRALRKGDVIGICAPASAPEEGEHLQRGIRYLERIGYRVKLGKNLSNKHGYFAGTDQERAADVNNLFSDPTVKAIFVARGGYGSHRILPMLNFRLIRQHPKILVGYSDITALQLGLFAKTGLVTFSGPMVASDLGAKMSGDAEESLWRTLTSAAPPTSVTSTDHFLPIAPNRITSSGRIVGGNLSLVAALIGTNYFPALNDIILLLEEIDERPYRIDRMLQQLHLAGIFKKTKGIALGQFINCSPSKGKPSLTLTEVFQETFSSFRYPILSGFRYGHINTTLTLPIGIMVRLSSRSKKMEFLESPVER